MESCKVVSVVVGEATHALWTTYREGGAPQCEGTPPLPQVSLSIQKLRVHCEIIIVLHRNRGGDHGPRDHYARAGVGMGWASIETKMVYKEHYDVMTSTFRVKLGLWVIGHPPHPPHPTSGPPHKDRSCVPQHTEPLCPPLDQYC